MKWFSAVVLSLLFCFVTSLKTRAIRAHLKNGMARGDVNRERVFEQLADVEREFDNKLEVLGQKALNSPCVTDFASVGFWQQFGNFGIFLACTCDSRIQQ
eukprot:Platyproteum_vivax@DN2687_c0_g1_i1.p1